MTLNIVSLQSKDYSFFFGKSEPVLRVKPGTVVEMYTEDCFGGAVTGPETLPSQVCVFPFLNPVTGPIYVEGAMPGDTLAVHFIEIEPARDWAVSSTFPHFGALTTTHTTAMLHDPLEERVWRYDVDKKARTVTYHATKSGYSVSMPLDPMHGTVGVAPGGFEARATITPDAHGGNMDTPEIRKGATVYFGVNQEGGLLAIGDGHCRQGEGEVIGTAVEAAMNTVIVIDLIKGIFTPWPRIENDLSIMSTGSTKPLEDAYRISQHDLINWVAADSKLDILDALQLVSQAGRAPVGNVVDPNYTFVSMVDKKYLPTKEVMGGTHGKLSAIAAEYRKGK
ncbi:MAG: acetamidase/formamidase family protein [Actinomycetales bacterium]|nr:acetamidase/formamidase family protein [Actinomycetales bacterium]